MADFRQIHCHIWRDNWFSDLNPEEKLLYIYLFSNTSTSASGIYEIPLKIISFETGLSQERASEIIDGFQKIGKVFYENGIVWVPKMRFYQESSSSKLQKRIELDIQRVPEGRIKSMYLDHISEKKYPIDTISIPYPGIESDTEPIQKRYRKDTDTDEINCNGNFYENPKLLPLWVSITGMLDVPGDEKHKVIPAFEIIYKSYKSDDSFIADGKRYFGEWRKRRGKDGRPYSKQNCSWFYNWWVSGEIPGEFVESYPSENGWETPK